MTLTVLVSPTVLDLSADLAAETLDVLRGASGEGRALLVGVPAGRTLVPVVDALEQQLGDRPVALDRLVLVMMDDYVLPDGEEWKAPPLTSHFSCRRFGEEARDRLNAAVAPLPGIRADGVWSPDATDPASYDRRIEAAGGIDLFFVAVGASDGHVAFNPPGTPLDSRTRLVPLAETTRRDNLGTFPEFSSLADVPTHGVSVGLATIAGAARLEVVAHGAGKAEAVRRLVATTDFDPAWPASFVHRHADVRLRIDADAAAALPRDPALPRPAALPS